MAMITGGKVPSAIAGHGDSIVAHPVAHPIPIGICAAVAVQYVQRTQASPCASILTIICAENPGSRAKSLTKL